MSVQRAHLHRALLILQALISEAERRGYLVAGSGADTRDEKGATIAVRDHRYQFNLFEMSDRVPISEDQLVRWRKDHPWRSSYSNEPTHVSVPNGRLKLSFPTYVRGRRSTWTEGPRGALEAKLPSVFAALEEWAAEDDRIAAEFERAEQQRQRELEARLERERLARIEKKREERLLGEVLAWQQAAQVRQYVVALTERLLALEEKDRQLIQDWIDWARRRADGIDPTVSIAKIRGLLDPADEERTYPW